MEPVSLDEYYERLGLPSAASAAEIKRAYRRLRAQYHPDRNKGEESAAESLFKKVQEAFEILTGQRQAPVRAQPAPAAGTRRTDMRPARASTGDADRGAGAGGAGAWSKHYGASGGPMPVRGANRHTQLHVPLDVALNGGEVLASYQVSETCRQCRGASARATVLPCSNCAGYGTGYDGASCTACGGEGRMKSAHWCATCQSKGVEYQTKSQPVNVPRGAWDGQRIVVPGGGFAGMHGGQPGDATFTVVIVCGPDFQREGLHLSAELEVDFVTATLGGPLTAKVLGRDLDIAIPANARHGSTIRLPAQGLSDASGNRGELRLRIVLVMPEAASHLSAEERRRFRELFALAAQRAGGTSL